MIPLAPVDGSDAQSVAGWRSSSKVVLASLADVRRAVLSERCAPRWST